MKHCRSLETRLGNVFLFTESEQKPMMFAGRKKTRFSWHLYGSMKIWTWDNDKVLFWWIIMMLKWNQICMEIFSWILIITRKYHNIRKCQLITRLARILSANKKGKFPFLEVVCSLGQQINKNVIYVAGSMEREEAAGIPFACRWFPNLSSQVLEAESAAYDIQRKVWSYALELHWVFLFSSHSFTFTLIKSRKYTLIRHMTSLFQVLFLKTLLSSNYRQDIYQYLPIYQSLYLNHIICLPVDTSQRDL